MRVLSDEEYNLIWDRIFAEFEFKPLYKDWKDKEWIKLSMPSKVYKISNSCWDENTEKRVNGIFETVATGTVMFISPAIIQTAIIIFLLKRIGNLECLVIHGKKK